MRPRDPLTSTHSADTGRSCRCGRLLSARTCKPSSARRARVGQPGAEGGNDSARDAPPSCSSNRLWYVSSVGSARDLEVQLACALRQVSWHASSRFKERDEVKERSGRFARVLLCSSTRRSATRKTYDTPWRGRASACCSQLVASRPTSPQPARLSAFKASCTRATWITSESVLHTINQIGHATPPHTRRLKSRRTESLAS